MNAKENRKGRALVVGGSLGGLFTGLILREAGWDVDIFERSAGELESRGGGIVLQPQVVEVFRRAGLDPRGPVGVLARERIFLDAHGNIEARSARPQTQTSWGALYRAMREAFPEERYHAGERLVDITQDATGVTARFEGETAERGDILVAADGGGSTVRRLLLPEIQPEYAGYVAYRGLVPERDADEDTARTLRGRFTFYQVPGSQMLCYLVAGDGLSVEPGHRRYNWVWYRNVDEEEDLPRVLTGRDGRRRETSVAPGRMALGVESELRAAADALLPPPFRKLVAATSEPFVQAIQDLAVPRMAVGRVAFVGDSAFIPRPHTAASTAKAAQNALALADALEMSGDDVSAALRRWEPAQLRYGLQLRAQGQMLGDQSQFPDGRSPAQRTA